MIASLSRGSGGVKREGGGGKKRMELINFDRNFGYSTGEKAMSNCGCC